MIQVNSLLLSGNADLSTACWEWNAPTLLQSIVVARLRMAPRLSDIVACVILVFVSCSIVYLIALHTLFPYARIPGISQAPNVAALSKDTEETPALIKRNIEYIQSHRPSLIGDPPIAENLPYRPLIDVVEKWNPDHPDIPEDFQETLQHFDYGNPVERAMAEKYRNKELPFKLYNVTDFHEVAAKWTNTYLHNELSAMRRTHVELSKNNHFMYWTNRGSRLGYTPPTEVIDMSFDVWLEKAIEADSKHLDHTAEHYYFMASAAAHEHGRTFISRDLQLFSTEKNNFFITNVNANKGIQCRFGMRGVIAESHYDSGRNMVAMLKGAKRYILNPPWTCKQLGIINDKKHPSYRHSVIDWSDMKQARDRGFAKVDAIDTVLRTGQVLYIPTYWFHYMVSLNYSIQCNSRSGLPPHHEGEEQNRLCMHQ